MAGRKPKSDKLKVIQGSYRKDRKRNSVEVDSGIPECPQWIKGEGRQYWKEIAPILHKNGLLADIDQSIFSLHCDSYGLYIQASKRIKNLETMIDSTPQGHKMQSAIMQIRNKLWEQVMKSGKEFGLSVQSRAGITLESTKENQGNPFGRI